MAPPVDGFDAMEARFEGVFQADNMDMGGAWGGAELYQGVEPMGKLCVKLIRICA